jgi:hypothetical protein
MKIKTLDINAKEWHDKINGNTYFSAQVTINYGTKTQKIYYLPFQYGYDNMAEQMAAELLKEKKYIDEKILWWWCKNNKVILRSNITKNCLKKDVKNWGIEK